MLALSQIIFGVRNLDAASHRVAALGFDVLDGGVHPGVGTANRVIPLGEQYLELLGVVAPEQARRSEYGQSLLRAIADGDRLVRWSLRTDAIDDVAQRLGIDVEARTRRRPDGELLSWRAAGLKCALEDATLPFFMQWDRAEQYPGLMRATHRNGARGVVSLSLTPRDAARFQRWSDGADAPLDIRADPEPGLRCVAVATNRGELVIDACDTRPHKGECNG